MTRHLAFLAFLAALLSGCATVRELPPGYEHASPITALSRSPYASLKAGIDTLFRAELFPPSNAGVKIVSLDRRETLYELNTDMLFTPASNQKLFTTALALRELGPGHLLTTRFHVDSAARRLTVQGSGDPLLSSRELDSIAALLAPALAGSDAWAIGVDARYFDDQYWGSGWTWDGVPYDYQAAVTPLTLDLNTVTVIVEPDSAGISPPLVRTSPPTAYVAVQNSARSIPDTPAIAPPAISRDWRRGENRITVTGDFAARRGRVRETVSVSRPELYCASFLAEKLGERGVKVSSVASDTAGPAARAALDHPRRLDSVVMAMNKESINLCAESLLKTVGAVKGGLPGSADAGLSRMRLMLAEMGMDSNAVRVADGSGVSRYNLTSAAALLRLLESMHADSVLFPVFYRSLPIAGVDGTIGRRMRGTPAEGNLRAKTGTLAGVTSLSGYVRTADGELLAFSMLMQDFAQGGERYRAIQNSIGALLASLRRSALEGGIGGR